eukprot:TRINITY_DN798_c0_g1_i1.p1 TRINITY_DN798_c0_g1~~TRINITY_DN798_c0_g1_i1.p1  ORF type:complete len:145 (+),score=19.01 TRINITY_DN798_c0_g1_i1:18-452(+)
MFWSRLVFALILMALAVALPSVFCQIPPNTLSQSVITFDNESSSVLTQINCTFSSSETYQSPATVLRQRQTTTFSLQSYDDEIVGNCFYEIGQDLGLVEFIWDLTPYGPLIFTAPASPGFGVVTTFRSSSLYNTSLYYNFQSVN